MSGIPLSDERYTMELKECLNQYMDRLGCNAKDLAASSGLSPSSLSRYRTGERKPDTPHLHLLLQGLKAIAHAHPEAGIDDSELTEAFSDYFEDSDFDYTLFLERINRLIRDLELNVNTLSRALNFDPSYLSRIRLGQRRPANQEEFTDGIATFIAQKVKDEEQLTRLAKMMECPLESLLGEERLYTNLCRWLSGNPIRENLVLGQFFEKLNEFDLNEYIRSIHFDELKVPTVPFRLPSSKTYQGLEEMMAAELDWIKATVLGKSMEPVIMYSDMPMDAMAKAEGFEEKYLFGMAMMLKKGLHFYQIHNLDRSFEDMMLGLKGWIPLYMTGQVSPYYFPNIQNNAFLHLLRTSGSAVMHGYAITGHHESGRYYVSQTRRDISYYRAMSRDMLSNAQPLMEIYDASRKADFYRFTQSSQAGGALHRILAAPPIFTVSEELLTRIVKRCDLPKETRRLMEGFASRYHQAILTTLEYDEILDEIPVLTREEFEMHPVSLPLSEIFPEKEIHYRYEEYQQHLELTKAFAEEHPSYRIRLLDEPIFRNLEIVIKRDRFVMVSKNNTPCIHFVIRHPRLRDAIDKFFPDYPSSREESDE